jgi:hypothetical protein
VRLGAFSNIFSRLVTTAARTMEAGVSICPPEPVPQMESFTRPPLGLSQVMS